jgi:sugar phosphate permease
MQTTVMVLLMLGGIVNYLDRSALAIANVPIRQELGLNATEMGVLLSAFLLAYAFAQIPIGFLIDKLGPRILLGIGITLWSAVQTLSGLVSGFTQFYIARVLLGLGEATQFPTGIRVISNWYHVSRRGLPTGIFNSAAFVGTAIAPPLLTWLMLAYGWRAMFVAMGAAGLVVAILWVAIYRDPEACCTASDIAAIRAGDTQRTSGPVNIRQWGRLFGFQTPWGMIVGSAGSQYLTWLYYTWLPGFLVLQQHMSLVQTGFFAAIPPIIGTVGSLIGGYVVDALARRDVPPMTCRKIPAVTGLCGTAILTLITAYTTGNTAVVALISASYLLAGFSSAAIWSTVTVAAPPDYVGSYGSIHLCGSYIGATASPIVTGFIVDQTGSFQIALIIGAAMELIAAAAFLIWVTRPISGAELDGVANLPRTVNRVA